MKKVIFLVLISCLPFNFSAGAQTKSTIKVDSLIPQLLATRARMTKNNEIGLRYRIQLTSNTYAKAKEVKSEFERKYGKWAVELKYEPPNYKVRVGNFNSKLEAERAFVELKKDFKSAFIFRPKD